MNVVYVIGSTFAGTWPFNLAGHYAMVANRPEKMNFAKSRNGNF